MAVIILNNTKNYYKFDISNKEIAGAVPSTAVSVAIDKYIEVLRAENKYRLSNTLWDRFLGTQQGIFENNEDFGEGTIAKVAFANSFIPNASYRIKTIIKDVDNGSIYNF